MGASEIINILVCGDREWSNKLCMERVLDYLFDNYNVNVIIHGGCRGADLMADDVAYSRGIHTACIDALWKVYGNPAGPRRNLAMLNMKPDLIVGFHDNIDKSSGTANMLYLAERRGIDYFLVED